MIDIVVVANNLSHKPILWEMTDNTLRTATAFAGMDIGRVLTIEQNRQAVKQTIGETMYYDFEFNYNRCLNLGFSMCNSQYVAFCNNDLHFERNWAKFAVGAMEAGSYLSACPSGRQVFTGVIEGYVVGTHILGWCIIVNRNIFDIIDKFSEIVSFWYSDNVYAVQLECARIKHILVGNSKVRHLKSKTLLKIPENRTEWTTGQREIYEQFKKEMYANSGIKIEAKKGRNNRR